VVYKSYYEGKSHSEIAGETGMPLGSVKSSLRLAIKAFRQHFGEDGV
jgi:DNA-directed RNA polymerase specialized sigma24 family protein